MKKLLKKYFIPHQENENKPHFLRWKTTVIILCLVLFVEILFLLQTLVISPRVNFFAEILSSVIIQDTNTDRTASNLQPLAISDVLTQAAQEKAQDMVTNGYFAHTSPGGITPWHWFDLSGYKYLYAGENLAINFSDSKEVVDAWMNSPTHRANIVDARFTEIGIGTAQGNYQGRSTTFIVQFFGRPQTISTAAVAKKITSFAQQTEKNQAVSVIPSENSFKTATAVVTSSIVATPIVYGTETSVQTLPINQTKESVTNPSGLVSKLSALIIASPHSLVTYLFAVLATIILLALVLKIGIKYKIQHPRLITNGALMLIVIGTFLVLNQYIILARGKIF